MRLRIDNALALLGRSGDGIAFSYAQPKTAPSVILSRGASGAHKVISDAVMVALLSETIMPGSPAKKIAAQILLDQIRHGDQIDVSEPTIEVVRADAGVEVAQAMQTLAGDFGSAGEDRTGLKPRQEERAH